MSYILDPSFYGVIKIKINSAFLLCGLLLLLLLFYFILFLGWCSNSRSRASKPEGRRKSAPGRIMPSHPPQPTPSHALCVFQPKTFWHYIFYLIYFEKSPPSFKSAPCTVKFFFFVEFPFVFVAFFHFLCFFSAGRPIWARSVFLFWFIYLLIFLRKKRKHRGLGGW